MAISVPTWTAQGGNQTAATTLACASSGALAVGDLIVVFIAADNAGASGASSIGTPTDSAGHTYTQLKLQNRTAGSVAADGCTAAIYATIVTNATVATLTANFSVSTTAKCVYAIAFRGAGATIGASYGSGVGSGTGTAYTAVTTASVVNTELALACVANESATVPAANTDALNGTWVEASVSGGGTAGDTTKMALRAGYKIVTATATQTFAGATGVSTDWAEVIVAFPRAIDPPRTPLRKPIPRGALIRASTW
jgi:hypothetical protein